MPERIGQPRGVSKQTALTLRNWGADALLPAMLNIRSLVRLAAFVSTVSLSACAARAPVAPPVCPELPTAAPPAKAQVSPPVQERFYLDPKQADGDPLCFDVQNAALRRLLANVENAPKAQVSAAILADDLSELRRVMRRYYTGWSALTALSDFDVEEFFDQRIAALRAQGDTKLRAGQVLGELLATLRVHNPDNHLWIPFEPREGYPEVMIREFQAAASAELTKEALGSCRFAQPELVYASTLALASSWSVSAKSEQKLVTVSAHGPVEALKLSCNGRDLTLRPRAPVAEENTQSLPAYEWKMLGNAAIVRVRRLAGDAHDEALLEQIARDYPKHAKSKLVVFDFRGNGGGNDDYIHDWIAVAQRGQVCSRNGEYTPPWGLSRCFFFNWRVIGQAMRGTLDTPEAQASRANDWAEIDEFRRETPFGFKFGCEQFSAEKPYRGRVIALLDHQTGSSGESGAVMLAEALGARIVGERSVGAYEYGNIRPYLLAGSGTIVQFGGKRTLPPQPVEGVGVPVDLYLDEVSAPIEQLLPSLEAWLATRR